MVKNNQTHEINAQNNKNVGEKVCVKLTAPYFDSERKRSLTADIFFSSISLANNLIKKNISFVGTLRKNKKEIPSCFYQTGREQFFLVYLALIKK